MQAIRNKLHGKSKRNNFNDKRSSEESERTSFPQDNLASSPSDGFVESSRSTSTTTTTETITVDNGTSFPTPPPMPPVDFWKTGPSVNYWNEEFFFPEYRTRSSSVTEFPFESSRTMEMLPTEIIEKPAIIHENVRREEVEEIQPIVRVEREKTEIRQITQPLTDKEIKPVLVEERVLPLEVLPTVTRDTIVMPERTEMSTRSFDSTMRQVVEKAPIVEESEKWRIIEEIQPIIYRETIIPHVIRTSRPIREVIVEAPIFTERVLGQRELTMAERERYSQFFTKEFVSREAFPVELPSRSVPLPVIPEPVRHKKEIIEDTTTTTTTTTVAPVIGDLSTATRSTSVGTRPVVVEESHTSRFGPKGETITRDTLTTSSQTLLPTRAN